MSGSVDEGLFLTTIASAMLFGTVIFATVACTIKLALHGDWGTLQAVNNPRSSSLDTGSFTSIFVFLFHCSVFGLIMMYSYVCENHPPHPHGEKTYDKDDFFFMIAMLVVLSLFTLKKNGATSQSKKKPNMDAINFPNDATDLLNRDQTEEWKGWMQFTFLMYHYHHAVDVYNAIRVMITCYIFMTGFGNFSFFYVKHDYSAVRVLQMLWRLNFLVVFLCLVQGTTYILYYICLLHTFYFLLVYITMRAAQHLNYTKWGMRIKMMILALIIFAVWDLDLGIFRLVHFPFLREEPSLGATSGGLWEWYFRSSLDHWSAFVGMVFVMNLFFRKLESSSVRQHFITKTSIAVVLVSANYLWVKGQFVKEKLEYNQTHAYFACLPVLCYIYIRNLTPWLRAHSLGLLHQVGKTTLETYLMQHHIWLSSNSKSVLVFVQGWPKINFIVVSVLYFAASRRLYQLTLFLRGMILPNDKSACFRNLFAMGAIVGAFMLLAFVLQLLEIHSLWPIFVVSCLAGMLLFTSVLEIAWPSNRESSKRSFSTYERLPTMLALLCILFLGGCWNHMSKFGATKNQPLTASCAAAVQRGKWIPVGCSQEDRGAGYRSYGTVSYGTCMGDKQAFSWGWKESPPSTHCRPLQRDETSLLKALRNRNVTFVGDSIVRHIYHAMCRQMGDSSAGAYNTSLGKWSDYSRFYQSVDLEFRWAPYVDQMVETLTRIHGYEPLPDIVIVGGGPWDKLHRYETAEQKAQVDANITILKDQMEALRAMDVSIIWVVPTTMNTWGLMTPEKRLTIREDQIEWFRGHFAELGINSAASFVLDGPSFTSERVGESYDGVHYPLSVYDAGAQILANSFDWLLPSRPSHDSFQPPKLGTMAHSLLGLCVLFVVFVGLFAFDGFFGFTYVAAWFVAPDLAPYKLYDEAFLYFHKSKDLPLSCGGDGEVSASRSSSRDGCVTKSKDSDVGGSSSQIDDDELELFLRQPFPLSISNGATSQSDHNVQVF